MAISQIPVKFIFHSYSESSTFGRPGLGRSIPHQMAISQIPALLSELIFSRPTVKWQFHRFLLWQLTFHDSSYFIPTLRAQHLADQVLADVPPFEWQFHWFLLWQLLFHSYSESLSFGRPGLGRSTSPSNGNFTDSLLTFHDSSYFIPTLRAQHLADRVLADLPPFKWQFHRLLLWQLLFHSYSESLSFGRPGLGISTPPSNSDFTDSCSDSSLLWELNIWQTSSWQM